MTGSEKWRKYEEKLGRYETEWGKEAGKAGYRKLEGRKKRAELSGNEWRWSNTRGRKEGDKGGEEMGQLNNAINFLKTFEKKILNLNFVLV